ncbi:MAG TPA: SRPBCC family protein [Thermoleophilaceae bacterium]|nr:SRPBCC family protein [Thermoleophilaceae bacterium]
MSSYRQQTLIEAPVESVWRQVGDPNTYPSWAGDVVEVTELDELKVGAQFRQKTKTPLGTSETPFVVEQLDDMREIQVRCLLSGYYLRWLLTEAGDDTFAEVEVGMDPKRLHYRAIDVVIGKRWYRGVVDDMLDRLRTLVR